jgi:hypothetical protein
MSYATGLCRSGRAAGGWHNEAAFELIWNALEWIAGDLQCLFTCWVGKEPFDTTLNAAAACQQLCCHSTRNWLTIDHGGVGCVRHRPQRQADYPS